MWWTGDTGSEWSFLQRGIANGVDMGLLALSPYVGEDLGGHTGQPSDDLYIRYLQYGCLSPTTRIHCTSGRIRYPWTFSPQTEQIVNDYIRFRYLLMPTLYSAAQRATEDGTPIVRRNDLEWPAYKEASRNDEYMLGDDLLVAPISHGEADDMVPVPSAGYRAEFFDGAQCAGVPLLTRTDSKIDFDWGYGSPAPQVPKDKFCVRWTGDIGPLNVSGEYTFLTRTDDGVRLWIDGKKLLDFWEPQDNVEHRLKLHLNAGYIHRVRFEYLEIDGQAKASFRWALPQKRVEIPHRTVWIPPGQWTSIDTGETFLGPKTIRVEAPLWKSPVWARTGGIIVTTAHPAQFTQQRPWDRLNVDVFPLSANGVTTRTISEDDGVSNDYLTGKVVTTRIQQTRAGNVISLVLQPATGKFKAMVAKRSWRVRFNLPSHQSLRNLTLDGKVKARKPRLTKANLFDGPIKGGHYKPVQTLDVEIPAASVRTRHVITFKLKLT